MIRNSDAPLAEIRDGPVQKLVQRQLETTYFELSEALASIATNISWYLNVYLNMNDLHVRAHTHLLHYVHISQGEHNAFSICVFWVCIKLSIQKSNGNRASAYYRHTAIHWLLDVSKYKKAISNLRKKQTNKQTSFMTHRWPTYWKYCHTKHKYQKILHISLWKDHLVVCPHKFECLFPSLHWLIEGVLHAAEMWYRGHWCMATLTAD